MNLGDCSKPIKLLHLAIRGSVSGSIAPQPRLLTENRSMGTLKITQGIPMPIWPGEAAVLAKQKRCRPPPILPVISGFMVMSGWGVITNLKILTATPIKFALQEKEGERERKGEEDLLRSLLAPTAKRVRGAVGVGSGAAVVGALARLVASVARRVQRPGREVAASADPPKAIELDARDLALRGDAPLPVQPALL